MDRELRRMRELWRVRKNGESIIGDLGYKICQFIFDLNLFFGRYSSSYGCFLK